MPRRALAIVFAGCAIFALLVAIFSNLVTHRFWGTAGACGYGLAAVAALGFRPGPGWLGRHGRSVGAGWLGRHGADVAVVVAIVGALFVPLIWMAATNQQQPEVMVVARSAELLIHHGTVFEPDTTLSSTTNPNDFDPYLPLMAVFGLPKALFGTSVLTDPRVWFGVCFLIVFWVALRRGGALDPGRWTLLVAGSPVVAFELAVGGTDVPMVAFLSLGFALLWNFRAVWPAGIALGIGAAMKSTAWPAVIIAFAFIVSCSPPANSDRSPVAGWRAAWRFTGVVLAVLAVCVGPFLATHPKSLIVNTIKFPLGLAHVTSQAASPLPGHLIADTGHLGHTIAIVLLVLVVLGIGVSLLVRPPRTVPAACVRLVIALTLMFLMDPSTRFGYFIYPGSLLIWVLVCRAGRAASEIRELPSPGGVPAGEPRL
jgi:hypothetical protein